MAQALPLPLLRGIAPLADPKPVCCAPDERVSLAEATKPPLPATSSSKCSEPRVIKMGGGVGSGGQWEWATEFLEFSVVPAGQQCPKRLASSFLGPVVDAATHGPGTGSQHRRGLLGRGGLGQPFRIALKQNPLPSLDTANTAAATLGRQRGGWSYCSAAQLD